MMRDRHAGKRLGDAGALGHRLVEADEDDADRAAMAFDHRVGGERRRDRDQRDVLAACRPCGSRAMAAVIAPVTPIARSPLVVIALAEATTLWPSASITAASV